MTRDGMSDASVEVGVCCQLCRVRKWALERCCGKHRGSRQHGMSPRCDGHRSVAPRLSWSWLRWNAMLRASHHHQRAKTIAIIIISSSSSRSSSSNKKDLRRWLYPPRSSPSAPRCPSGTAPASAPSRSGRSSLPPRPSPSTPACRGPPSAWNRRQKRQLILQNI
eukprot:3935159-Rhodomonas_salina.7